MYTIVMIFLIVVSSFSGVVFLTVSATGKVLKKQELKAIRSTEAPAALPKPEVYSVSAEEYYLIH